jgi:Flp pilus assembly protein TadG
VHVSRFQRLSDPRGATLVIVAIWLPVLVLFATLVLDVGNWFVHKRHLQTQADAGALAAGGSFNQCFGGGGSTAVENMARRYAGDTGTSNAYNSQVGGANRGALTVRINSKTYAVGGPGPDDTVEAPACTAKMVDVKTTEADLPLFLGVVPHFLSMHLLPAINAHARVEIRSETTSRGALPVGVPDVNPVAAIATLVNDSTGAALSGCTDSATGVALPDCTVPLAQGTTLGSGVVQWDSTGSVATVPIGVTNVGVRIALAGTALCNATASPQCAAGVSAASGSALCNQVLVTCYETGTSTSLVQIRGWSSTPSGAQPNPPQARSVQLTPGSGCADPYFSSDKELCPNVRIAAHIDSGSLPASSVIITAFGGNCPNKGCTLVHGAGDLWTSGDIGITGGGVVPFTLKWEETSGTITGLGTCRNTGSNPCKGTFAPDPIRRSYIATDALSGPIKILQVWNYDGGSPGTFWADSFQSNASPNTHKLVIKLGITASLANAQSVGDPVVALRVIGGSQNQSLDCDPNYSNLADELASGCRPTYSKNTGQVCPNSPSALWGSAQPWPCVAVQTGNATNQVPKGLNTRVLGDPKPNACPAAGQFGHNNWSQFPNLQAGDPRIIHVFLTPFGSFSGSGSTTVPVVNFATFYLTGWTGQGSGFNNPCQGNGDDPVPNNDAGIIVGHFIKYIDALNSGGGGTDLCDFTAFGNCVSVLTR